jgi:hypothetical protein
MWPLQHKSLPAPSKCHGNLPISTKFSPHEKRGGFFVQLSSAFYAQMRRTELNVTVLSDNIYIYERKR